MDNSLKNAGLVYFTLDKDLNHIFLYFLFASNMTFNT